MPWRRLLMLMTWITAQCSLVPQPDLQEEQAISCLLLSISEHSVFLLKRVWSYKSFHSLPALSQSLMNVLQILQLDQYLRHILNSLEILVPLWCSFLKAASVNNSMMSVPPLTIIPVPWLPSSWAAMQQSCSAPYLGYLCSWPLPRPCYYQ